MSTLRALVVTPTLNENATLERVVEGVLATPGHEVHVLVVDDASTDGTAELADRLATGAQVDVLHRPRKLGLGSAYRAGFSWGLERGYEAFVEIDADLSHDPADVRRLLDALEGADLAIGSRYVPGGHVVDWPGRRLALSRGGNVYVKAATGLPVRDATAGFRAYRRAVLEELDVVHAIHSEGYSFQIEMALRTWRAGFAVVEVPITFTERREGASKMNQAIVREALWRVAGWATERPRHPAARHPQSAAVGTTTIR